MGLLDGRYAAITGAAGPRGLGRAMAQIFADHGATIAVLDLDVQQAQAVAAELGPDHVGLACDVTDKAACDAAMSELIGRWGRIDILVNNAGITQPLKLMQIEAQNYDAVLDVNLRGTLYASQAVIPQMRQQNSGAIVNISSVSAQRGGGIFGGPHYSAAKAGILGLTKAMARELAPDGIRVNAICPGFIGTDITAGKLTPEMKEQIIAGIPMGRVGDARDVAGCALFLASDLSAYVTGSEVDVNGGSLIH
ncbi:SDR family NAD(P)-dependent oxidoreductase [Paracoccus tegillarcae]|uniref:Short-chain dehydrogenase n=1 Tax=Paracoccus tegillarcae TaxID=1529068 RepID=A0A2K9ED75_9RHOB|nr:SDR family NAD(P)-dependent oxidoreductase [Paracoccus tegillarcae]AUH32239.1 short-chain dehydrogenase [Paracoccus tegillarcae]